MDNSSMKSNYLVITGNYCFKTLDPPFLSGWMTIFHVGDLKCKEKFKSLKPQRVFNFIIVTIICCFLPSKFTLGPDERSAIVFLLASLLPWSFNSKSPGITLTSKEPRDPRRSLMSLQRRRTESEARLFIFSILLFIFVDHFMILLLWLQKYYQFQLSMCVYQCIES